MHLFFMRHGKAADRYPGLSDFDRPLLEEGIQQVLQAARCLKAADVRFDLILTSPLLRALQTAQSFNQIYALPDKRLHVEENLASGVLRLGPLQSLLSTMSPDSRILIVGHEPDLSAVVSQLTGGCNLTMKKGAVAYVEAAKIHPDGGSLRWLIPPRFLIPQQGDSAEPVLAVTMNKLDSTRVLPTDTSQV